VSREVVLALLLSLKFLGFKLLVLLVLDESSRGIVNFYFLCSSICEISSYFERIFLLPTG